MKGILEKAIEIDNQIKQINEDYKKFNKYEKGLPLLMEKFVEAIYNIKLMTGWASKKIFEDDKMYKMFSNILKNGRNIYIVFNKKAKDLNEAIKLFKRDNPRLSKLKEKYPDHLRIYWTEEYPIQHYALIDDNKYIFYEDEHISEESPSLYFKQNDLEFGNFLNNSFNEFIKLEKTKEILN